MEGILTTRQRDSEAGTTALEREIDRHVCELYGLTEEEIAIVEGKSCMVRASENGMHVALLLEVGFSRWAARGVQGLLGNRFEMEFE